MRKHPLTGLVVIGAVVLLPALGTLMWSRPMLAQPGDAPGGPPLAPVAGGEASQYVGPAICSGCHTGNAPNPLFQRQGSYDFCLMNETATWFEKDMHALAYDALKTDLGVQMGKLLDTDVTKDVRCLTCHALDTHPTKALEAKTVNDFDVTNGVSCEACHGPAANWGLPHANAANWRYQTPEFKSERGMINLRDPIVRATNCASCHVGNVAEGKFVTHEMYAAGHPPLPGFEILTFSEDMPRHWMLKKETPAIKEYAEKEGSDPYKIFHYREEENEQARLLAIGALINFRESMRSLALEAEAQIGENGQIKGLIDFAYFDCYACHHDLAYPSWRQQRGYPGTPGRPTLRAWPIEMTRVVLGHAEADAKKGDLDGALDRLRGAVDARPFGDPKAIHASATQLAEWSDQAAKELDSFLYTPERTRELVMALIDAGKSVPTDPKQGTLDYEAAQQLAAAFNVLSLQLGERSPEVEKAVDDLSRVIQLNFRSEGERKFIADRLPERLSQLYDFTPQKVRDAFLRIDKSYSAK